MTMPYAQVYHVTTAVKGRQVYPLPPELHQGKHPVPQQDPVSMQGTFSAPLGPFLPTNPSQGPVEATRAKRALPGGCSPPVGSI